MPRALMERLALTICLTSDAFLTGPGTPGTPRGDDNDAGRTVGSDPLSLPCSLLPPFSSLIRVRRRHGSRSLRSPRPHPRPPHLSPPLHTAHGTRYVGNRTDCALLLWLWHHGVDYRRVRLQHRRDVEALQPFSSVHKCAAVRLRPTAAPGGARYLLKGAAEMVLQRCAAVVGPGGRVEPLTATRRGHVAAAVEAMARRGLRCVALAHRVRSPSRPRAPPCPPPASQTHPASLPFSLSRWDVVWGLGLAGDRTRLRLHQPSPGEGGGGGGGPRSYPGRCAWPYRPSASGGVKPPRRAPRPGHASTQRRREHAFLGIPGGEARGRVASLALPRARLRHRWGGWWAASRCPRRWRSAKPRASACGW